MTERQIDDAKFALNLLLAEVKSKWTDQIHIDCVQNLITKLNNGLGHRLKRQKAFSLKGTPMSLVFSNADLHFNGRLVFQTDDKLVLRVEDEQDLAVALSDAVKIGKALGKALTVKKKIAQH